MQTVRTAAKCQQIEARRERQAYQEEEGREVWPWPKENNVTTLKRIKKKGVSKGALALRVNSLEGQNL